MTGKYSIYSVEETQNRHQARSHALLALVREEEGGRRILEQLDFNFSELSENAVLIYELQCKGNVFLEDLRGASWGHIGGDAQHISQIWAEAVETARAIQSLKLKFDFNAGPEGVNCRSGMIAVLKNIGLDFVQLNSSERGRSGTKADIFSRLQLQSEQVQHPRPLAA